jgi:hypothetical protein
MTTNSQAILTVLIKDRIENGCSPDEIFQELAQDNTEAEIDAAMLGAARLLRVEAEGHFQHAEELDRLRRAARAPGAKTIGDGLRQRAKTGDKEAIRLLRLVK